MPHQQNIKATPPIYNSLGLSKQKKIKYNNCITLNEINTIAYKHRTKNCVNFLKKLELCKKNIKFTLDCFKNISFIQLGLHTKNIFTLNCCEVYSIFIQIFSML